MHVVVRMIVAMWVIVNVLVFGPVSVLVDVNVRV